MGYTYLTQRPPVWVGMWGTQKPPVWMGLWGTQSLHRGLLFRWLYGVHRAYTEASCLGGTMGYT